MELTEEERVMMMAAGSFPIPLLLFAEKATCSEIITRHRLQFEAFCSVESSGREIMLFSFYTSVPAAVASIVYPGLPNRVLAGARENLPRRYPRRDSDVFAFVKRYVSDTDYSQTPLVVYPGSVQRETIRALQRLSGPNCQGWNA